MNNPEFNISERIKRQMEVLKLGSDITDVMRGQVPEESQGSVIRNASWNGNLLRDPDTKIIVGYVALFAPEKVEEDVVINERGPTADKQQHTLEITYGRRIEIGDGDIDHPDSVFQTVEVQSGIEKRRARIEELEVDFMRLAHETIIRSVGIGDRRHPQ